MKPVKFKHHNQLLGPPPGMNENECMTLPVFTDGKQCLSCWELSDEEIKEIIETKRIWLAVMSGNSQPPVWLSTAENVLIESPNNEISLN
mgnify:CR=1 FL=1